MRDSVYQITLDIRNEAPQVQISAKRGDSLRQVRVTLTERGLPYSPAPGWRAVTKAVTPSGGAVMSECELRSDGTLCWDLTPAAVAETGLTECEIAVLDAAGARVATPRFTILVLETAFEEGARLAGEELKAAVEALKAAEAENGAARAELEAGLSALADEAKGVFLVTAQYNFESDYVIAADRDPETWETEGKKVFILRLTDGNRTLDLTLLAGSRRGGDRWLLAGVRPAGESGGMPYLILDGGAEQPEYVYAAMGIDNAPHDEANCMLVRQLSGGRWLWISKPHAVSTLSGTARDGQITPAAEDVFSFLPLSAAAVAETAGQTPDLTDLHALPAHTVTYVNTAWFASGTAGLAAGWYYVCTTGKLSGNYGVQLAMGSVNGRLYISRWHHDSETPANDGWGDWASQRDATLALQGAAADAKTVGDLFFAGRSRTAHSPVVPVWFSDGANLASLWDLPAWSVCSITGEKLLALEPEFPDADEIVPNVTYSIEKRASGANPDATWLTLYRQPRETVWTGYTPATDETHAVRWRKALRPADATLTAVGAAADAAVVGAALDREPVFEFYGDHEDAEPCWWTAQGTLDTGSPSRLHSARYPIRPGAAYYLASPLNTQCLGAFFDAAGNYLAPLRGTTHAHPDVTPIAASYTGGENTYLPDQAAVERLPAGENTEAAADPDTVTYPAGSYMTFGRFTAPEKAAFISLNLYLGSATYCRSVLCSEPVYMARGTGNLVLRRGDPALQRYGNKRLCLIGPSTLMINRLLRAGAADPASGEATYTAGLQEYLRPFFREVKTLGYSGAGYAAGSETRTNPAKLSICHRICGTDGPVTVNGAEFVSPGIDLSGYDVFVFFGSSNGLTAETLGENGDTGAETFCGAIRRIIQKIYADNPKAEVHLMTFSHTADTEGMRLKEAANEQLRLMAEELALGLVDSYRISGMNPLNFAQCKSADKHLGNEGNRRVGLMLRRHFVGF